MAVSGLDCLDRMKNQPSLANSSRTEDVDQRMLVVNQEAAQLLDLATAPDE